jgi:hypothetical protein
MSELPFTTTRDGGSASTAGSGTGAPALLRAQAKQIRHLADFAQGLTRIEELEQARDLERQADRLEQQLSEA